MRMLLFLLSSFFALTISGCNHKEPAPVDEPDAPGIHSVEDFLAFASAVNKGASTKEWENEEGWVNLFTDLDFAGVTDYEPVGYVTAPWENSESWPGTRRISIP